MTKIEKQVIIDALCCYSSKRQKEAEKFYSENRLNEAVEANRDKVIASGLADVFRDILDEASGTCKI